MKKLWGIVKTVWTIVFAIAMFAGFIAWAMNGFEMPMSLHEQVRLEGMRRDAEIKDSLKTLDALKLFQNMEGDNRMLDVYLKSPQYEKRSLNEVMEGKTRDERVLVLIAWSMERDKVRSEFLSSIKEQREAANDGDAEAQFFLGGLYWTGLGVEKSDRGAFYWFQKAAEQGESSAQATLGLFYKEGREVAQNDTEAVKWFRKSAEQGSELGQYFLGDSYAEGLGVAQSDTEAVKWYRMAAKQGDDDAQRALRCYDSDELRKAAVSQENEEAQYVLGMCYAVGRGVAQSDTEAIKWYRKAAERGQADAQLTLGVRYAKGKGVVQSNSEALRWFKAAADQGQDEYIEAQMLSGRYGVSGVYGFLKPQ
ncbi:hypothetical protein AGMMS49960_18720 [Betaproteobacteria bacterium]|nr:hypothetical protein AGMMS49543_25340 [Betaproteobacteria bacterium]GHU03828.1 hypothetical protein AGMMS49960_18720 [Betaproteobacteria bacterium]GHU24997.1 hypothetical protein AGMMS50243_28730 [Betaproteobacteria bacterium]